MNGRQGAAQHGRRVLAPSRDVAGCQPGGPCADVDIGTLSYPGRRRHRQADCYLTLRLARAQVVMATNLTSSVLPLAVEEYAWAMCIAEEQGVSADGNVASRVALSTVSRLAVHYGHWDLRVEGTTADAVVRLPADQATPFVAAYITGNHLCVAHVRHSGAFLFHGGALKRLAGDRSPERRAAQPPRGDGNAHRQHEIAHQPIDAPGGRFKMQQYRLWDGDRILLCTDALSAAIGDDRIAAVMARHGEPAEDCRALAERGRWSGDDDDITVIVADYHVQHG